MRTKGYTVTQLSPYGSDQVWTGQATSPEEAMQSYDPYATAVRLKRDADYQVIWMGDKGKIVRKNFAFDSNLVPAG